MNSESAQQGSPEAFADLIGLLLSRWRLVVLVTVLGAAAGGVYSLLAPRSYQARATLLPRQEGNQLGLLGSVMEMSGLPMLAQPVNEGLYGKILCSNTVMARLAARTWPTSEGGEPRTLYELMDIDITGKNDRAVAESQLFRKLGRDVLSLSRDKATGYMEVRATVRGDPVLASALANAAVDEIDRFNIEIATTKAGSQFAFLEERLSETLRDLSECEGALTNFIETNRAYRDSPSLLQQYRRLEREVEASKTVWIELRRQAELSNLEQHKNLSSVAVLDRATPPSRPIKPNRVLDVLLGACFGLAGVTTRLLIKRLPPRGAESRSPS